MHSVTVFMKRTKYDTHFKRLGEELIFLIQIISTLRKEAIWQWPGIFEPPCGMVLTTTRPLPKVDDSQRNLGILGCEIAHKS